MIGPAVAFALGCCAGVGLAVLLLWAVVMAERAGAGGGRAT